jgi:hypothetical protein
MPYISPQARPAIDEEVEKLASVIVNKLQREANPIKVSEFYFNTFQNISKGLCHFVAYDKEYDNYRDEYPLIYLLLGDDRRSGAWLGNLNYALTTLIQAVPYKMYKLGIWKEALRYWLYAETVGALVQAGLEINKSFPPNWVSSGLVGVLEDVKDEYKRRVNVPYEAEQILKSGDCYDKSPFRTKVVETTIEGITGRIEVMLPKQVL